MLTKLTEERVPLAVREISHNRGQKASNATVYVMRHPDKNKLVVQWECGQLVTFQPRLVLETVQRVVVLPTGEPVCYVELDNEYLMRRWRGTLGIVEIGNSIPNWTVSARAIREAIDAALRLPYPPTVDVMKEKRQRRINRWRNDW